MKQLMSCLAFVAAFAMYSNDTQAQQKKKSIPAKVKDGVTDAAKDVDTAAKKTAGKVAETASKTSSRVVDKVYKGKTGPDGQTIYINNKSQYYWIDKGGHRVYITASELKDKN